MKLFGISARATDDVAQARVDAIVSAAKAKAKPLPLQRPSWRATVTEPLTPSEDVLDQRIEEELRYARRLVEALGDALCDDPILMHRHQVTLQGVDVVAQMLGHLATVVGSVDRSEAIDRIGMHELRGRLQRAASVETLPTQLARSEQNPFNVQ